MSESPAPIGLSHLDASAREPGELLRAAREAQGLSLEHLAATLKVTPAKLAALEGGRLDQLPDASFARALAQTVCRVLKIDPAPVLAGLPAARTSGLAHDKPALNQPFKETRLAAKMFDGGGGGDGFWSRWMRPQWLAPIFLLAAAAFIYLLPESVEWPRWGEPALPASAPASLPVVAAEHVASVPAAASEALTPDVAASPASAATTSASPVVAAASSAELVPVANASTPPLVGAIADADGPVVVKVSQDSWMEVVDGAGNVRVSRVVRSGESLAMGGVSPWRMRIGNAGGVQVTLRGQPLDLTPHTRNNVARLELK